MPDRCDVWSLYATGRVADLVLLLPFLPPRPFEPEADAARAADAILQRAAPEDIGWLERHRSLWNGWESAHPRWDALLPDDLGADAPDASGPRPAVIALASMHPNGFVRERAVRLLAARRDGGELPFLLVRVNDWVPPVRAAAETAVRARLEAAYAAHFVRCFTLVDDLRGNRRAPHRALIGDIEALLCTQAALPALDEALRSGGRTLRRTCARLAARIGDPALLYRAAMDSDPIAATAAARVITTTWSGEALREALPRLRLGLPRIRCLVLQAICSRFSGEAEPHLRRALLDDTCSVRELARFLWTKTGLEPLDFAAFYREALALAERRSFAAALHGLAETGKEVDAPLFEPHLQDPRSVVRAAAVMGLGRCGMARYGDALLAAMKDPSSKVAAVARRWVRLRLGRAHARRAPPRG
ncbi:Hypothetical protein A7982_04212 [Minicystis rosea]|nr:Hypothetical protein A7982_04212 [Minicystis rosea]